VAGGGHAGRPDPFPHRRELAELGRKAQELTDVYFERLVKPELRPPGERLVSYLHLAFPSDVRPGKD
jgi:hypothetical protein